MANSQQEVVRAISDELQPFLRILDMQQTVERHISFDINCANHEYRMMIDTLQTLSDANDIDGFNAAKMAFEEAGDGYKFRITDTEVFLYKTDPSYMVTLDIAVQVKGSSITWYFYTDDVKDEYSQEFRDILFRAAAKGHEEVKQGCGLYYRGSNAFHVKTMHVNEKEAFYNHNHYRVRENAPVTPEDFAQHMRGIVKQARMDEWFRPGEEERIIEEYNTFYQQWTHKEGSELSAAEKYAMRQDQKLNKADILEFYLFGAFQEPCRISVDEIKADYDSARAVIEQQILHAQNGEPAEKLREELRKITAQRDQILDFRSKGGSRGLSAEYAMTRQVTDSVLPSIEVVPVKDDKVVDVIDFRDAKWAINANKEVDRIMEKMLQQYYEQEELTEKDKIDIARLERISGKSLGEKQDSQMQDPQMSVEGKQLSPHQIRQKLKEQKGGEKSVGVGHSSLGLFGNGMNNEALLDRLVNIKDSKVLQRIFHAMPAEKIDELEELIKDRTVDGEKASVVDYSALNEAIASAKESGDSKYNMYSS